MNTASEGLYHENVYSNALSTTSTLSILVSSPLFSV